MLFSLYDYENQEYLAQKDNIDGIIGTINAMYHYEEDFISVTYATLADFLVNARLGLLPA